MLELLGLLLKAIITIAIGIIGFTWEPKQELIQKPIEDEKSEILSPVYFVAPPEQAYIIQASNTSAEPDCVNSREKLRLENARTSTAIQARYLPVSLSS